MDRIKARIGLLLVTAAVSTVFIGGSPARAADSCYPYPEQYCNTMNWFVRCVWWRIEYGQTDPSCSS